MDFFEKQINQIKKSNSFKKKTKINPFSFSENLRKIIGISVDEMKALHDNKEYIKIPYSKDSIKWNFYKYYLLPVFERHMYISISRVYFKFYDKDFNRVKLTLEVAEDIYRICGEIIGIRKSEEQKTSNN